MARQDMSDSETFTWIDKMYHYWLKTILSPIELTTHKANTEEEDEKHYKQNLLSEIIISELKIS